MEFFNSNFTKKIKKELLELLFVMKLMTLSF